MKLNYVIIALLVFAAAVMVIPASAANALFLNSTAYLNIPNATDVPAVGSIVQFTTPPGPVKANTNYYVIYVLQGPPYFIQISDTPNGAPSSGWVMPGYKASTFTVIGTAPAKQTAEFLNGGYFIYTPNTLTPPTGTKITFVSPPKPLVGGATYYVQGGFNHYIAVSATPNGAPIAWNIPTSVITTLTITPTTMVTTSAVAPTLTKTKISKTKITRHH